MRAATAPSSRWRRRDQLVAVMTGLAGWLAARSSVSSVSSSPHCSRPSVQAGAVLDTESTCVRPPGTLSTHVDVTASGSSSVVTSSRVSATLRRTPASSSSRLSRSLTLHSSISLSLSLSLSLCRSGSSSPKELGVQCTQAIQRWCHASNRSRDFAPI